MSIWCSQASPRSRSAKASTRVTFPARIDLTSEPTSTMPGKTTMPLGRGKGEGPGNDADRTDATPHHQDADISVRILSPFHGPGSRRGRFRSVSDGPSFAQSPPMRSPTARPEEDPMTRRRLTRSSLTIAVLAAGTVVMPRAFAADPPARIQTVALLPPTGNNIAPELLR